MSDLYRPYLTAIDNDLKAINKLHQEAKELLGEISAIEGILRGGERPTALIGALLRQVREKYAEASKIQKDISANYDSVLRHASRQQAAS